MKQKVWSDLSIKEQAALVSLYDAKEYARLTKKARELGLGSITIESLKRYIRLYKYYREKFSDVSPDVFYPLGPKYNDWLEVSLDNVIIASDFEVPDQDAEMCQLLLAVGKSQNISTLIIAGDFFTFDQAEISSHERVSTTKITAKDVVKKGKQILREFNKVFEKIYMIQGNHDDMIARKLSGQINPSMFLDDIDFVHYSDYYYMWLKTSRKYVYITHPVGRSASTSLALGRSIYNKVVAPDGTKPDIVLAHTHKTSSGYSEDGMGQIFGLGPMRASQYTEYKSKKSALYDEWVNSFLVVKEGICHLLSKDNTDWGEWIK